MRHWLIASVVAFLCGCAISPQQVESPDARSNMGYVGSVGQIRAAGNSLSADAPSAGIQACQYFQSPGGGAGGHYYCPLSSHANLNAANRCAIVPGLRLSDGTQGAGMLKCEGNAAPIARTPLPAGLAAPVFSPSGYGTGSSGSERSPCVYSNCGPVQVKGYYRKDGAYVRPHTRRRSR